MTGPPPSHSCAVCGAPAKPPFHAPPPELAPDLDFRPGEPTRSTLPRWVQTCKRCGLSAPDLARPPARARDTVETPDYRALSGPAPEFPFLRHALLCEVGGESAEAAEMVLQAAWALDDAGQDAGPLRLRAAALWGEGPTTQDALRVTDTLRRARAFEAAGAQAGRVLARARLEETDRAVLSYQQTLIAARDSGRHLLSSALRPPARTPHASHGRKAPGSFWQRLAGR